MPRFYFDSHDGIALMLDEQGTVLPDVESAKRELSKAIASMASNADCKSAEQINLWVTVRDGRSRVIAHATVQFKIDEMSR